MPPKTSLSTEPRPSTSRQKKFKPPLLIPHPPPIPPSDAGTTDSHDPPQSQQGDDEMVTLGQILESMMKASKDRRVRRRKEIEQAYREELAVAETMARKWIQVIKAREKRHQIAILMKLKALLSKKQEVENNILTAFEALEGACEKFGSMLKISLDSHEVGYEEI